MNKARGLWKYLIDIIAGSPCDLCRIGTSIIRQQCYRLMRIALEIAEAAGAGADEPKQFLYCPQNYQAPIALALR
jgi:hypothetical protein